MYTNENFEEAFDYMEKFPGIGIELFPLWNTEEYASVMEKYKERLKKLPISYHEQYYETEHSAPEGDIRYKKTEAYMKLTLASAKELNSRYIVYHYNNCAIPDGKREEMLTYARKNLQHVNEMAAGAGIPIVVENTGIPILKNVLLNEEEFIEECLGLPNNVLIDIGHAWCNQWNFEHVIKSLQKKIVAYHIHNNDGIYDLHQRIHHGTLDFNQFFRIYKKYTPDADLVLEYVGDVCNDREGIQADIRELNNKLSIV